MASVYLMRKPTYFPVVTMFLSGLVPLEYVAARVLAHFSEYQGIFSFSVVEETVMV